ncbi:GerMN domain-containing protein [Geodermatophilus sp. SYSU D01106]
MRRAARGSAGLAVVAVAVVLLTGCGLPGGAAEAIPDAEVPYGLLSASGTPPAAETAPTGDDGARIHLLGPGDLLTPRERPVSGADLPARLDDLLGRLAAGPDAGERAAALTTVLPPGTRLTVTAVEDGTATVDLTGPGEVPDGEESRLAVAQIVLTATTLSGVEAVRLTRDGEPLEAPLPTGELTDRPLTAEDYGLLLAAPPR